MKIRYRQMCLEKYYTRPLKKALRLAPESHPENVMSTLNTTHPELGGHDALRYGTRSIKTEWSETQWELKLNLARQAYGMHAPIKMMMEKSIVEKRQHMPIIPSSNLHLDILMVANSIFVILDPSMSTDSIDFHTAMEHKLNLKL
ncbi:hypothetical protein INT48_005341 [Thamnidium elegans]|uniref:Uncharacterized protein n=1 Tax=Thamnidium elegans TaxID=101142 RepID=A0A8H7SF98_9FUNG|nr:hypothetical protein INT48_005341 [Thamnidium elegans]